jgi:Icc protein
MLAIAHLSDTHLNGSPHAAERVERVMGYVNGLDDGIDAIVVTGDIADHGLAAEYAEAAALLVSAQPVLLLPGNHDIRAPFREVLLGEPVSGPAADAPINRIEQVGGAAFLLCDSTVPGQIHGLLAEETVAWIADTLGDLAAGTPVFLCVHHPPMPLGMPFMDGIRLTGEQQLAELIREHPDVVAVLCGHAHSAAVSSFAGVPVLVAPGVSSTVALPWEPGSFIDYRLPPGLAFHLLDDDRRLVTHFRVVP